MLKNLVGLVTGGASGLGKATVEKLSAEGCNLVVCDLPKSRGKEVVQGIGKKAIFSPTDIRSTEQVEKMFDLVVRNFGKLNFIVNCAGIASAFKVYNFNKDKSLSLDVFNNIINTNLVGTFNVLRLGAGIIGKNELDEHGQSGVMINTAGIEAYDAQIGQTALAAASGGIVSMTLPLARDLGERGIRVVCICPGVMETPLTNSLPEKVKFHIGQACPTPRRFGKPEEYAHLVKCILENPYMNGEVIRLDAALRLYFY